MIKIAQWTLLVLLVVAIMITIMGIGFPKAGAQTISEEIPQQEKLNEFFGGHQTILMPQKSEIEIIAEQAQKLAQQDILLSKYAAKIDSLRFSCK